MGVRIVRTSDKDLAKDNITLSNILKRCKDFDKEDRDMILKDIISILLADLDIGIETRKTLRDIVFRYAKPYMNTKDDVYLLTMYKILLAANVDKPLAERIYDNVMDVLDV